MLWCWRPAGRLCSQPRCSDRQQHDTFESRQQRGWHLLLSATPVTYHPTVPDDICRTLAGSGSDPHPSRLLQRTSGRRSKVPAREVAVRPPCHCQTRPAAPTIVRRFQKSCEDSCTGSRCQIVSDSNCVPLYTVACRDSLLTTCLISARLPQSTLIWDHLWHSNGRCQSPGRKPRRLVRVDSTLLRLLPGMHSKCICATLNFRWTTSKLNWILTFSWSPSGLHLLFNFVRRAHQRDNL